MKILDVDEQADGSAIVKVYLTVEEVKLLLEIHRAPAGREAIVDLLKEFLDKNKTNLGNTRCREFGCVYGTCLQPGESEQPCYCTQITGVPSKE
ncbi:hypothetical protein UFOVP39_14 [uncultured Caudovirales phage]|uniref:Uncharacterized protein n=1 Tax=uncultured Caudovirales phage TaxID=2100421 RepID=A0A6J5T7H6_9CAUD|nr:hypothetical protein UFOVP39_14 [uncultured Caudovirales phage]